MPSLLRQLRVMDGTGDHAVSLMQWHVAPTGEVLVDVAETTLTMMAPWWSEGVASGREWVALGTGSAQHTTVDALDRVSNVAATASEHFEVAANDLICTAHDAAAVGRRIACTVHSHPHSSAVASEADRRLAGLWPGIPHIIVGRDGTLAITAWPGRWRLSDPGTAVRPADHPAYSG